MDKALEGIANALSPALGKLGKLGETIADGTADPEEARNEIVQICHTLAGQVAAGAKPQVSAAQNRMKQPGQSAPAAKGFWPADLSLDLARRSRARKAR